MTRESTTYRTQFRNKRKLLYSESQEIENDRKKRKHHKKWGFSSHSRSDVKILPRRPRDRLGRTWREKLGAYHFGLGLTWNVAKFGRLHAVNRIWQNQMMSGFFTHKFDALNLTFLLLLRSLREVLCVLWRFCIWG